MYACILYTHIFLYSYFWGNLTICIEKAVIWYTGVCVGVSGLKIIYLVMWFDSKL